MSGGAPGEGLFETVLVLGGEAPLLDRHVARATVSARALALWDDAATVPSLAPLIRSAWEHAGRPRRGGARITLAASGGGATVAADVSLRVLPDRPEHIPWTAVTVAAHRVDPTAAISGHKVLSWLPWTLARREARARGAGIGLVRTVDGDVCEADHANLFVVRGGAVVTPSLDRGVLPGITRASVIARLRAAGRPVAERVLTDLDLASADEIFVTSSLSGVRAIGALDGRPLTAPAPVCEWLATCALPV